MAHSPESSDPHALPPAKHQTTSISETHMVDPDRRPGFHTVVQGITALEPIRQISYYFDTDEISDITAHRGCTLGEQRPLPELGLRVAELLLTRPLRAGERATLKYTTWFNYRVPPAPEYRRRVGANEMSLLDMCVQFEKGCAPAHIWEARWPSADPDIQPLPDSLVEVEPQDSLEVPAIVEVKRQEVGVPPGVVLGYLWEW